MLSAFVLLLLVALVASIGASGTGVLGGLRRIVAAASLGGLLGFLIGFVGPMIIAPDAAQGPLLGIFITGPAGFGLGAVVGIVREIRFRARLRATE